MPRDSDHPHEDVERVCRAGDGKPAQGRPERGAELARLTRRQEGAAGLDQLRALGYSDDEVAGLVADSALRRWYRGVYVDARSPATPRTHLFAALFALGPTAFLSHRTAAALHGLRRLNLHAIELTVVSGHTPKHHGLVVHRTARGLDADELRIRDGLRVSSVERMFVELAAPETRRELERLLGEAARRRLLDLDHVQLTIERHARAPGLSRLRAALLAYQPPTANAVSTLERDVAAWLATHPEIPAPQRNVHLEHAGARWEIDFLWTAQRLALETDGSQYHRTPSELERDRVKDAWLQRHGFRVLRVTDFRFAHDRSGVLQDLRALLGMRRAA